MSNQSPSTSNVTNCSVMGNNNVNGDKPIETFKWTTRIEHCLLANMVRLKPAGINKHLSMILLKKKMEKELKLKIPIKVLWNYVSAKWDIRAADCLEGISFDTSDIDFALPKNFAQLIVEEGKKIKNLNKECLNDEINKRKLLNLNGKTRPKSKSMSSVNSKKDLNKTIPSTLLESSPAKTNVCNVTIRLDNGPRRSLRVNEKLANRKNKIKK